MINEKLQLMSLLLLYIILKVLASDKTKKGNDRHLDRKRRNNTLFANEITFYTENLKKSTL